MKNKFLIRFFDVMFSSIAILILLPLFVLVIIILSLSGEGEIFYLQKRVGIQKKLFNVIKFATMMKNSEFIGNKTITVRNDPRVLFFGKILRKTKVNELPQLINILIGDMSIVGPRPLLQKQFSFYPNEIQNKISTLRPGLTGIGSLVFRDEEQYFLSTENPDEVYKKKISPLKGFLELWFVENHSLYLYFKIIIFTVYVIIFPKNNVISFFEKNLKDKYDEILG